MPCLTRKILPEALDGGRDAWIRMPLNLSPALCTGCVQEPVASRPSQGIFANEKQRPETGGCGLLPQAGQCESNNLTIGCTIVPPGTPDFMCRDAFFSLRAAQS